VEVCSGATEGVSVLKNRTAPWDVIMAEEEVFVEEKEQLP
jgi:hypothetical protein